MYRDEATGRRYAFAPTRWCSDEGAPLDLDFAPPALDWARVRARPPGLWRYREALPLGADEPAVSLGEPETPCVTLELPDGPVVLKQDQLFPTGSYKDRGAAVLVAWARARGVTRVVQDSSGNAGCAVAAYCARAGLACTIYVPEHTSPAKLVQMRAAGAEVVRVPGEREDTARAARAAAAGTFYASHCWNPVFLHGTKTFAYELYDQLRGALPDAVVLPVGNGTLLLGAHLGFAELVRAGDLPRAPRLYAVQSALCDPVARAARGEAPGGAGGVTLAEGIAITAPPRLDQMVRALRATGGDAVTVTEAAIRDAWEALARQGFYVEPTAAAAVAGVAAVRATLPAGATVLAALTGTGLKSTEKLQRFRPAGE